MPMVSVECGLPMTAGVSPVWRELSRSYPAWACCLTVAEEEHRELCKCAAEPASS